MRKTRGIVLKIKKDTCIVATRGREFHEVALPDRVPLIGEEIMVNAGPSQAIRRLFNLRFAGVAVLIVALLVAPWFSSQLVALFTPGVAEAAPAAYVAVDVNPSFELGVDEDGYVVSVDPLNGDAGELLDELDLVGMTLDDALAAFTEAAIEHGYLSTDKDNVVLLGVVLTDDGVQVNFDPLPAYEAVNNKLEEHGLTGLVHMHLGTKEERDEARENGLSLNREDLLNALEDKGVTVEQAANTPLPHLVAMLGADGFQEFLQEQNITLNGKHEGWFNGVVNALQKQEEAQTRFMQRLEERASKGDEEPSTNSGTSNNGKANGKDKDNNGRAVGKDEAPGQNK